MTAAVTEAPTATRSASMLERGAVLARLQSKVHGAQCVDVVECHLGNSQLLLCVDKHTQMTTADPRLANAALRELDMHLSLQQQQQQQHKQRSHVVQLYDYCLEGERLHLFQEYCARGDLLAVVRQDVRMETAGLPVPAASARECTTRTVDGVRRIVGETLAGVAELHRAGIAHLDLSLENVFITADGHVRVGDLGLAERFQRDGMGQVKRQCPQSVAKVAYAAPEMHAAFAAGIPIDVSKADAWALGVLLWHLWAKTPLFQTATRDDPLFRRMERDGSAAALATRAEFAAAPSGLRDLLAQLLRVDPVARLSVLDAQSHLWLRAPVPRDLLTQRLKSFATAAVRGASVTVVRFEGPVAATMSNRHSSSSSNNIRDKKSTKARSGSCGGEIALEKTRVSIRHSLTTSASVQRTSARARASSSSRAC